MTINMHVTMVISGDIHAFESYFPMHNDGNSSVPEVDLVDHLHGLKMESSLCMNFVIQNLTVDALEEEK